MLKDILFDQRPDKLLTKMLDKAAVAQRVISSNVANVATPGYQKLSIDFDERLKKAMRTDVLKLKVTDPRHMSEADFIDRINPQIVKVNDGYWNGVNNVNIDQEMVDLGKNQLDYNTAIRIKTIRGAQLKTAIRGKR